MRGLIIARSRKTLYSYIFYSYILLNDIGFFLLFKCKNKIANQTAEGTYAISTVFFVTQNTPYRNEMAR